MSLARNLFILVLAFVFSEADAQTSPDDLLWNGFIKVFSQASIPNYESCPKIANWGRTCKLQKQSDTLCTKPGTEIKPNGTSRDPPGIFDKMYATWEQNEKCKNYDYFGRAASNHLKNAGWVFNITTNWTSYFNSKARTILENGKGTFICQFAAKRYWQLADPRFFHGKWQPSGIKCVNYLADARRAMMCASCDSDEKVNIRNPTTETTSTSKGTEVLFNYATCTDFMGACLDYIENKQKFIDKMNVAFTLALCDRDGLYLAQSSAKSNYKKVLPSNVIFDEEDVEFCRKSINKDLAINEEESQAREQSCLNLCHKHFSLSTMILDDIATLNHLKYMHDILKEIVMENMNVNLFNQMQADPSELALDFTLTLDKSTTKEEGFSYKFANSTNVSSGMNLEKYIKDNGFKVFDAALYVKSAGLLSLGWFTLLFSLFFTVHVAGKGL